MQKFWDKISEENWRKMKIYTEEDEETLVISELLRYADHHMNFNRKFIDDMYDFFEKEGYITENQYQTLLGIYNLNVKDKEC